MTGKKLFRKKIGDVFEVKTSKGLAYFQYTHEHKNPPSWGSLVRVLQGFYNSRPSSNELEKLVELPHRFQTFCFLQHGIKEGEVMLIGNFPIPSFVKKFPIFKNTNTDPKKPSIEKVWWLWDGEKSWKVGKLSLEDQKKYPFHGACDIPALIMNIETGKSLGRELC